MPRDAIEMTPPPDDAALAALVKHIIMLARSPDIAVIDDATAQRLIAGLELVHA